MTSEGQGLEFVCDRARHLVCVPFSVSNLHRMADVLGINRCWFHQGRFPHCDVPKRMIREVSAKCRVTTTRNVLRIVKGLPEEKDEEEE